MPAYFDATGMKMEQFEATSKDGTKIPYFVVTPKGFKADGTAPTLLYGYGGFEISRWPATAARSDQLARARRRVRRSRTSAAAASSGPRGTRRP